MADTFSSWDVSAFHHINQDWASPFSDYLMVALSSEVTWITVGVLWLFFGLIRRRSGSMKRALMPLAATLILTDGISFRLLKPFFGRPRPCYQFEDVRLVPSGCGSDHGFPSNHAANGFGAATVLVLSGQSVVRYFWLIPACLVGLSRIYLGVHFPADVLFGAAVGCFIAGLVWHLWMLLAARAAHRT